MTQPMWSQGQILLLFLRFFDGDGAKRRPVLVVHDFGDADILVVPITSHAARGPGDMTVRNWAGAGLRLPSTVRVEKLATIEKSCVVRVLGTLAEEDLAIFRQGLALVCRRFLGKA